jgi:predicted transcriptional regulator
MDADDVATLRAALDRRHAVLAAAGTDVVDKRDLTERLSVSRSTVDRGVRELERLGLLERADGGYRRTVVGSLALEEYQRATERLGAISTAADVISHLPPDVDVDVSALVDAEVLVPTQESPFLAMTYMNDLIRRADRFRICATAVVPPQVELFHREVVENGMGLTGITSEESFDVLVSDYREETVEALETGRYDLYVTDERIPYGVVAAETPDGPEMCVSFCGDEGIAGTIANDSPAAVAWANERLDRYVETAESLSVS